MELISVLTRFGLNDKQARLYLACLELGPSSILAISKKSDINRATAYYIIEELVVKNLISITINKKKKNFVAAEPADLMNLIKEKEELLKLALPELEALNDLTVKKAKIKYFEGDDGMHRVAKDYLTANKEAFTFGTHDAFKSSLLIDPGIITKRIKNKIFLKMITTDVIDSKEWQKNDKSQLRKIKIVSAKKYPFQTEITVYNNKVSITSYKEKIGLIVESKPISETLKMIFNLCWDKIT